MITKVQPEDANNLRKMMGDSMSDDSDSTQADSDSRRSFFDLDPKDDLNTEVDPLTQEENEANVSAAGNNNEYWKFQKRHAYQFTELGNVIELADNLRVSDLASSLYYQRGQYYLELAFLDEDYAELKPADAWAIANEYGIKIDVEEMNTVKETGKCLMSQDALGHIRYYFLK